MFCQDIGVDAESFFSLEVKGQVTFIAEIGKVMKVWAVFQKERRLYVETSAFHWKKSVLQTSISFIEVLASKIAKLMVESRCPSPPVWLGTTEPTVPLCLVGK